MVYKDPASIEAQQEAEDELEKVVIALEVAVMAVIARKLATIDENTTYTDIYASMPSDIKEIEGILTKGARDINVTQKNILEKAAADNDEWAALYYKASGRKQLKFSEHKKLTEILKGKETELSDKIDKFVRTSVFALDDVDRTVPIADTYVRMCGNAAVQLSTGAATHQTVVRKAVNTLSRSGLRVVYPSEYTNKAGQTVKHTRDLYSAVTTNVMDGYRTVMVDMRMVQGLEFGADGIAVTAHALCAPDHQPYQGRQYTMQEFEQAQNEIMADSGRELIYGANCRHSAFPVILGISPETYTNAERQALIANSNEKLSFKGLSGETLTMSRYDASQYQRSIERSIRKANTQSYLLTQAGEPNATLDKAIKNRTAAYKRISGEIGLKPQMRRTKSYVAR